VTRARRIDHVGIAVESIESALTIYRALGLAEAHREEVPGQGVRTAFLPVGESRIELLEPTGSDSPVGRFLAKRGPGVHHVCFAVDDLDAAVAELTRRGVRLVNAAPAAGAQGTRVVFLHPSSCGGVLIELAERPGERPPEGEAR
jgi:methylmalonyl-CoA/ethylmalonyl-CoA epimerase